MKFIFPKNWSINNIQDLYVHILQCPQNEQLEILKERSDDREGHSSDISGNIVEEGLGSRVIQLMAKLPTT